MDKEVEIWMRGPIPGIIGLLQPVAHALLQVKEDVIRYAGNLDNTLLWVKPMGLASVGFHIQHITGVIDRMFTYARKEHLTDSQLADLSVEGKETPEFKLADLYKRLQIQVDTSIEELKRIGPDQLTEVRFIGRKEIPTTMIGLLYHAAEHAQRHVGQLLVTASYVKNRIL